MKKKILALCLVVVLAVTAVTGATLAYFTDTDAETNVFTYGNIDIDLIEDFEQDSELMPGKENAVVKVATIENEGDNDAYVWAEILIPAALDDKDDNSPSAPGLGNSLHSNFPGAYSVEYAQNTDAEGKYYNPDLSKLWYQQHNENGLSYSFAGTEKIGEVSYNKFVVLYKDILPAGETTSPFLNQAYMDAKVTQCDEHDDCLILADGRTHYTGSWEIIVRAYGIQEAGFDDVFAAYAAYDGAKPAAREDGQVDG